jgi:DUF4097 and DUF4098 domain-containing protein YvlB
MNNKLKTLVCLSVLALVQAAQALDWGNAPLYKETELTLDASNLKGFDIDVGPGDIKITGKSNSDEILVEAKIYGKKLDDNDFTLSLNTRGSKATLEAHFTKDTKRNEYIDLKVTMPNSLALDLNDRSGDVWIKSVNANVAINDRSGDIELSDIKGDLSIDDRSGDITVSHLGGKGLNILG